MHRNRICIEDTIAYKYAKKVADREIVAGKYVIMECERFLDDIEECKYINPQLTTIKMDLVKMADITTDSIIKKKKKGENKFNEYTVDVELIKRKSCMKLK